jgi:hypothetical protein
MSGNYYTKKQLTDRMMGKYEMEIMTNANKK